MKFDFGGNSMWQLVMQSDLVTKFVLLVLLAMSVLCWAIFLYKFILLRLKKSQMKQAMASLKRAKNFEELRAVAATLSDTLPGFVLQSHLHDLKTLLEDHPDKPHLLEKDIDLLQLSMDQTVEECVYNEEAYLPLLFTCASAAPLLGLFGTIWGLVHSFMRIAEKQSADITTVAPGIAEALITTLAGLIVAIPALIMYHYLLTHVKTIEQQLYKLTDQFNWIVQRNFIN